MKEKIILEQKKSCLASLTRQKRFQESVHMSNSGLNPS